MFGSPKTTIIFSSLLLGGTTGAFGTYKYSEVTVWSELNGQVLETKEGKADSAWTNLKTTLGDADPNSLSPDLTIAKEETNGTSKLRKWCRGSYSKVYKNIIWENKELLEKVKKYCSYKFGTRIVVSNRLTSSEELTAKINKLKTESESLKDETLQKIKEQVTDNSKEEIAKQALKDFCIKQYEEQWSADNGEEIEKWCSKESN